MSKDFNELFTKIYNEFMEELGYKDIDRFDNPNSPYYGDAHWIACTDIGATGVVLYKDNIDYSRVKFTYRNIDDESAVNWSKDFLDTGNIKYLKVEVVDDSEKGWFSVNAKVFNSSLSEKYGYLTEFLDIRKSEMDEE